jgi:hypothetical protein
MLAFRPAAALAVAGCLAVPGSSPAFLAAVLKPNTNTHHLQHLLKAEKDLLAAEAAIAARNPALAHRDVAAAVHEVERAVRHHHTHYIAVPLGGGLTGLIVRAQHQHHHGLLQQAVTHMRHAEKELKVGNGVAAVQHIEAGGKMLQASVASHYMLIGR